VIIRLISSFILIGFSAMLAAAPVTIKSVRIWAAPENTRVVFDLDGPVDHKVTSLDGPARMVIDLADAALINKMPSPVTADRFISSLRHSTQDQGLRIVLDLKQSSQVRSFQLPPNEKYSHRLVVDIYDGASEQAAREAEQVAVAQPAVTPKPETKATPVQPGSSAREVVIAIDAGHGGDDPGSIGPSGTYEKVIALKIAKKLAEKINRVHGMRAVLIRDGDYFISLRDRIRKARQHKADLFVSIHADAFKDPRVSGSSVYVLSQRGASSEHAKWLAARENAADLIGGVKLEDKDDVLASVLLDLSQTASLEASIDVAERVLGGLKKVGNVHKKRVESAAFAVLKSPDIPSLLIETAYISNPKEEKKLLSAAFQDTLTNAILDGLVGYFKLRPPENTIIAMNREQEHVITRGDTLSGIAERYRVSLTSLRQANGLRNDRIRIGQKLTIPTSGS
jgi:N-acetylmuramoyl-L-alanine amidase